LIAGIGKYLWILEVEVAKHCGLIVRR